MNNTDKPIILSGIQPTGNLHLGNYLGAICQAVNTQDQYKNFFFIADLHSITVEQNPKTLAENTYKIAALYLACGINPSHSSIFIQSHIPAHAELAFLLNCITPLSNLQRMTQFKEKSIKQNENISTGLLIYPTLMAADILLYQTDFVSVGEDQIQHLELTRDIAKRFNSSFAKTRPVFKIPKPMIAKNGARIMSLTNGTKKMSKSDKNDMSRINLLDSPELIRKKIKKAKTDTFHGLEFDNPLRPECHNLLTIYMLMTGLDKSEVINKFNNSSYGDFKPLLADAIIQYLEPIQEKYYQLIDNKDELFLILSNGKHDAEIIANNTLKNTKKALGFEGNIF